jgi:xanthine dehydrogenase accessory factor
MPTYDDVLEDAINWQREGRQVVLATVVATWGSAPRPVGSQLCIDETGNFSGSVSGGCIEAAVVREALAVLASGLPKLIEFHVTNDMAWEVGLSCGGRVEIFVSAAESQQRMLSAVLKARGRGEPVVLATALPGGEQALLVEDRFDGSLELDDETRAIARRIAIRGDSLSVSADQGRIFLHAFRPPPRLIIVGAVHITEPLSRMAASAGYEVVVIDPRRSFASRRQFGGLRVIGDWPDVAMRKLKLDQWSAVVTLTHDPKLDDAALRIALASEVFYIGCLGSRKTHLARLSRLRAAGFEDADVARVHGPVGLPIGARTPAEIAISILAEITQVRRGENVA